MRKVFCIVLTLAFAGPGVVMANTGRFETDQLTIRISARTPQQMAAFYEGRGFPREMIEATRQACFFTVGIKNKSNTILWHDLDQWTFTAASQPVQRFTRAYWKAKWQSLQAPLASQSTFRWTLMPEQLDFRPQEAEGGNITLPRGPLVYDIKAVFQTGEDKTGPIIKAVLTDIRCGEDTPGATQ
ncbi:MAG: hypothetical protein R6X06_08975 [Gammaproteobacteria bacterium]